MKKQPFGYALTFALSTACLSPTYTYADDGLNLSGFVDASLYNSNAAGTKTGITLDQVELDIEYQKGKAGLRFDLQSASDGISTTDAFEQGYVTYAFNNNATFTFGKFNAPIGWELLDAPDMYQYSHALVFDNGLPTNISGAMLSGSIEMFDYHAYISNGTDTNTANNNANGGLHTYGGRIGLSPTEGSNIGVSFLSGDNKEGTYQAQKFTTLDIDATFEGIADTIIGAEYNASTNWTAVGQKSRGFMLMAHHDFNSMFGATARYGQFDSDTATAGKQTAITGALTVALEDGMGALVEYRSDKDSTATTTVNSYAFEMTYSF